MIKARNKEEIYAKTSLSGLCYIIRKAFEKGSFSSAEELDKRINDIFNDENLIASIIRGVEAD